MVFVSACIQNSVYIMHSNFILIVTAPREGEVYLVIQSQSPCHKVLVARFSSKLCQRKSVELCFSQQVLSLSAISVTRNFRLDTVALSGITAYACICNADRAFIIRPLRISE